MKSKFRTVEPSPSFCVAFSSPVFCQVWRNLLVQQGKGYEIVICACGYAAFQSKILEFPVHQLFFKMAFSIMKLFSVKMWSVNIPLNKRIINFINAQDRPNLRMCRNFQFDSRVNWVVVFSSREIHFVSCLSKVFVIPNILQNALCFWYHGFHFYCQNDVDFYYRVLLSESSLFVYVCVCAYNYTCVYVCVHMCMCDVKYYIFSLKM